MEVSPLNKTAILGYVIDLLALKLWNVSSKMRKRVKYVLTRRKIILVKYDERAFSLNKWVHIGKFSVSIKETAQMKKGIANYKLETQEQFDKALLLNGQVKCWFFDFKPEKQLFFEEISNLVFVSKAVSNCHFKRINELYLENLDSSQITDILSKIETIDSIIIGKLTLPKVNFKSLSVKKIDFQFVNFTQKIELPSDLQFLKLNKCNQIKFLNCKRLVELQLYPTEDLVETQFNWAKKIKSIKKSVIDRPLGECFGCLPSSLREINAVRNFSYDNLVLSNIKQKFPYLIDVKDFVPIEAAQILNLRRIYPKIETFKDKFTLKPREIEMNNTNCAELNLHPELFEKAERIFIWNSGKFNFDWISGKLKKITIYNEIDLESENLIRL